MYIINIVNSQYVFLFPVRPLKLDTTQQRTTREKMNELQNKNAVFGTKRERCTWSFRYLSKKFGK